MLIKKALLITLLVAFLGAVPSVSAHFLATDHTIGAVLHMDPDDDPIAGSQTGFFFEIKDKTNKFTPANCDCTFVVSENGKQVYTQPLFQNNDKPSLTSASVFYTFPTRDVYQVQVIGKPTSVQAFQPFTLSWDVRVDRAADAAATASSPSWFREHLLHILGIGIILVFFIILVVSDFRKRQTIKKRR